MKAGGCRRPATGTRMARSRWVALLVATLACRGSGTAVDEIVLVNEAPVGRLDPRYATTSWEVKLSQLIAPGLTGLADRGHGPTPGLAASFDRQDDLTYIATLRDGARFSDGSAVTSLDVVYTFQTMRDPLLASPFRRVWDEYLDKVVARDARTVVFHLNKPRSPFPTDVETAGIVSRAAALAGDEATRAAARAGGRPPPLDGRNEVVGAGPYRIVDRSADEVVLGRNPHTLTPPRTERLIVRTIRDDNARVLALVGGSADVILNGVTPLVLETLASNPKVAITPGPSATLSYIGFHTGDPVLRQVKVRRAIAHAIDRSRLVNAKFRGHARLAQSPLDQGSPFFVPAASIAYDPAAARRLLDEAGYRDPDGDGPAPRFELSWKTSNKRDRVAVVQAMARQLGEVGIAVEVRPFDFGTFLDDVRKGNFQLFTLQMTDLIEPDMLRALFHSSRIPTAENRWVGTNRFRHADAELDRWLTEASQVADPAARKAIYTKVQERIARDLPMLPLWHEDNVLVHGKNLEDVVALKTGRLEGLMGSHKVGQKVGHEGSKAR